MSEHAQGTPGKVVEIKGVVIDAVFTEELPEIYNALAIEIPGEGDGGSRTLIAEVQQHLGDDRVRAVAMDSTDGLSRGVDVVDTGDPISVPVGDATLGRIWNVIGEPVDNGDAAGRTSSAGRSTATRPRSASSRRRSRSSRRGSRSST
jgi:F0F1-type ATP synthase beta subunit